MTAVASPGYGWILDQVRNLRWPARNAVTGLLPGKHASSRRGTSAEFTEYRPYRQGDPPQKIDWKLFARSDRAYIRLSNDHTVLPTAIIVDASGSMASPSGDESKFRRASELAIALAAIAQNGGDPVGLVVASGAGETSFTPRRRSGVIGEIARTLGQAAVGGVARLDEALGVAIRIADRVVLVSDMLGDTEALLLAAGRARAASVELYAVHVVAREELDPPGMAVVQDPELADLRRTLYSDTRRAYLDNFAAWRAQLADAWRTAGVRYLETATDQPLVHEIRRITARA